MDDAPSGGIGSGSMEAVLSSASSTQDPICCIAASDKFLLVGRESGTIQRYSLPNVALINRYNINTKPFKMDINCTST